MLNWIIDRLFPRRALRDYLDCAMAKAHEGRDGDHSAWPEGQDYFDGVIDALYDVAAAVGIDLEDADV